MLSVTTASLSRRAVSWWAPAAGNVTRNRRVASSPARNLVDHHRRQPGAVLLERHGHVRAALRRRSWRRSPPSTFRRPRRGCPTPAPGCVIARFGRSSYALCTSSSLLDALAQPRHELPKLGLLAPLSAAEVGDHIRDARLARRRLRQPGGRLQRLDGPGVGLRGLERDRETAPGSSSVSASSGWRSNCARVARGQILRFGESQQRHELAVRPLPRLVEHAQHDPLGLFERRGLVPRSDIE